MFAGASSRQVAEAKNAHEGEWRLEADLKGSQNTPPQVRIIYEHQAQHNGGTMRYVLPSTSQTASFIRSTSCIDFLHLPRNQTKQKLVETIAAEEGIISDSRKRRVVREYYIWSKHGNDDC